MDCTICIAKQRRRSANMLSVFSRRSSNTGGQSNSCDLGTVNEISLERGIMDLSSALYRGARSPKLQVVKKGGSYFALNDTKLKMYRHLEAIGQCWKVKVKIVPLREVPKGIRNLMQVPEKKPKLNKGRSKKEKKAQNKTGATQKTTTLLSTSTETSIEPEISSDEDSGNSSDWTNDEPSDTDVDSSDNEEIEKADESSV